MSRFIFYFTVSDCEPGYSGWHMDNETCRRRPPSVTSTDEVEGADSFKLKPIEGADTIENT